MTFSSTISSPGNPSAETAQQVREGTPLPMLREVATQRAQRAELAEHLAHLQNLLATDLGSFEAVIDALPHGPERVRRGAAHLLQGGGKRLRPICVLLAAKLGRGADARALDLAVAAELVHNATLLHDDVVDLGEKRRGALTSRAVFGNATSIFAGDWLLIEALKRVRRADVEGTFDRLLEVIEEMILAESIQLDSRGTLSLSSESWLRVVEGKTAALFRWAMHAGGKAGGLSDASCLALAEFGAHLGVAFQAVDDVLDLNGDPGVLGKELFADLREGKMTWPLFVGLERAPELKERVEAALLEEAFSTAFVHEVTAALEETGAIRDCRAMAEARLGQALASLRPFQRDEVLVALEAAARVAVERHR